MEQGWQIPQITDTTRIENKTEKPLKEGVDFTFEQNPKLASIGSKEQYSQYLDTIFPNSKVKNIVYHGSGEGQKSVPLLKIKYGNKLKGFSEEGASNYKKRTGHRGANKVGFYFSPSPERKFRVTHEVFSDFHWHGAGNYGKHIYPVLINFINPANSDLALSLTEEMRDELKRKGYDSVVATSDIPAIGSNQLIKDKIDFDSVVEYGAFEPEQIHMLGSEQDMNKFKEFIETQ